MRIMLDTNVLISALLFPGTKMDAMMNYIFTNHQLVLSSYVVDELKNVVRRKFPGKEMIINKLLMMMSFEYVYTPGSMESGLFNIRDIKDYPVLYTAIIEDVDILVTGDKDFFRYRCREAENYVSNTVYGEFFRRMVKMFGDYKNTQNQLCLIWYS